LLDQGPQHCAKKLGEEAVEPVIAALGNDRGQLIAESADLLFHLLVLLKSRGVTLQEVEAALAQRTAMSGVEENAARKRDRRGRDSLMDLRVEQQQYNLYRIFSREQRAKLRVDTTMTL